MRKRFISGVVVLVAAGLFAVWWCGFRPTARRSGPLAHEVYVWQRNWNQPVRQAVTQRGANFANLVALRAEIVWKNSQPQLTRVAVDYPTLTNAVCPVGLALRIGAYPGPFATNDPVAGYLSGVAASLVAEAATNGLRLSELQIDFDCAESKLDGYRLWVEAIQRRVHPLPVTITALPSWLKTPAFRRLAAVAPNYVLQVHSVERPKSFAAPFTLCDPAAARRAVERAGRLGVPFRVALPTYGYLLAFAQSGQFLGLSAEGPRPNWPADAQLREVGADPETLARLVQDWTKRRPAAMGNVIWYRLPVATDNLNWRWPTLAAILAGRSPHEQLQCKLHWTEDGLVEIHLLNLGDLDVVRRLEVKVHWTEARLVAGDGLQGFELTEPDAVTARFQTGSTIRRLRVGDDWMIGWLRFDRKCEVQIEITKH